MNIFDVYFNSLLAGQLTIDNAMRMRFSYAEDYRANQGEPISLTMPVSTKNHSDDVVFPFVENLLPEGEIRMLIQYQNKIEDGNFARFIELLGGDVAGALSIQPLGQSPEFEQIDATTELDDAALSQLLLDIQDRPFNIYPQQQAGNRLSLAGAQNKLPVIRKSGKTFEARNAPSTHIIKPPRKDGRFKSLVYNEYICMKAAEIAGIQAAAVSLLEITDVNGLESDALLITRYDRVLPDHSNNTTQIIKRLQQEDLCQLCSIPSTMKYEVNGGPGFEALFAKINEFSLIPVKDDIEALQRIIFNLIIGNYDAHAKNFSFLVTSNGNTSMSPAYDLVCTELYENLDRTFAMSIGEAQTLDTLTEASFKQMFEKINKKFSTIRKQLIKFADSSLKAVTSVVSDFREGDFYQSDIQAADKILKIAKTNHQIVLKSLRAA
ncbi:MAG: HipA domain-containing protein [Pseudomonadales bacterium]|nr:HipA domain-containing protein [Pseudomonadales bacterium]